MQNEDYLLKILNVKKRLFTKAAALLMAGLMCETLLAGCGNTPRLVVVAPRMADSVTESEIHVDAIDGLSDDFIRGVDISTIISQEQAGVKYYNMQGEQMDLFDLLSDAGVNYIRVRVWNDPYDSNGNGYGGGNNDVQKAVEIGKRAAEHGMKLCVDFHYSDFWADPAKQKVPKAWADIADIHEKASLLYDFTKNSLREIIDGGADVGIVQLGNETNKGMAGERQYSFMAILWEQGNKAVKDVAGEKRCEIKTALHFTNPEDTEGIDKILQKLSDNQVEYDIFAMSYYPFWHGSLENLTETLKRISTEYGKEVMVAETSYVYTLDEGDGHSNSASQKDLNKEYAATVQSQANVIRDVAKAVADVGESGLGIFYWEPAWIPVNVVDWNKDDAQSVLEANQILWEQYGCGWASSYAKEYDAADAGKYYGGSAWDNQALFDFNGKALPSLYTFKYLKYGSTCPLAVDFASDVEVTFEPGQELQLPDQAYVHYNDRSQNGLANVSWDEDSVSKVNMDVPGDYTVSGHFDDGYAIHCIVHVQYKNLIENDSFEEEDRSMWNISSDCVDFQQKESDATSGEWAMHYYSTGEVEFTATQHLEGLEDGVYYFRVNAQGGDNGASPQMYIFAQSGDGIYKTDFVTDGWINWVTPEIASFEVVGGEVTVGVYIKAGAGAWGTLDDFYLCKMK